MLIKKYIQSVIALLCVSLLVVATNMPQFVYAQTAVDELNQQIEEKRSKIKEIEKQIAQRKAQINRARTEANSLQNQIAILDNRVAQVQLDIEATKTKLETLNLQIEILQGEIASLDKSIANQKNILAEFLRNIHTDGHKTMLEVLATYDSFSDFYSQLQYLQTIEHDLGQTTKALAEQRTILTKKQQETDRRRLSYVALQKELTQKQKDLDEQVYAKENLFVETKKSEQTYQTLLSNLRKEYQNTENEITSIEAKVRARLNAENKINNNTLDDAKSLAWPVPSRYITARFRDPDYPYRNIFEHNAVDIRAAHGTPLRAAADGYVARARKCSTWRCYSYVMIIHSEGISTVYGHMSKVLVAQDQYVQRGDIIGYTGGTPRTPGAGPFVTGPHLHFEVRINGIPVDPLKYLIQDWL